MVVACCCKIWNTNFRLLFWVSTSFFKCYVGFTEGFGNLGMIPALDYHLCCCPKTSASSNKGRPWSPQIWRDHIGSLESLYLRYPTLNRSDHLWELRVDLDRIIPILQSDISVSYPSTTPLFFGA